AMGRRGFDRRLRQGYAADGRGHGADLGGGVASNRAWRIALSAPAARVRDRAYRDALSPRAPTHAEGGQLRSIRRISAQPL
ncbi:MAG: hypothetical protein ABH877_03275, partial [bacterium]